MPIDLPMISLEQFTRWLDEMEEMYLREQKQAIRQRNMDKAIEAVAGLDACERLRNYVPMRAEMRPGPRMMPLKRKRG